VIFDATCTTCRYVRLSMREGPCCYCSHADNGGENLWEREPPVGIDAIARKHLVGWEIAKIFEHAASLKRLLGDL
jgi:hypothetical protein